MSLDDGERWYAVLVREVIEHVVVVPGTSQKDACDRLTEDPDVHETLTEGEAVDGWLDPVAPDSYDQAAQYLHGDDQLGPHLPCPVCRRMGVGATTRHHYICPARRRAPDPTALAVDLPHPILTAEAQGTSPETAARPAWTWTCSAPGCSWRMELRGRYRDAGREAWERHYTSDHLPAPPELTAQLAEDRRHTDNTPRGDR